MIKNLLFFCGVSLCFLTGIMSCANWPLGPASPTPTSTPSPSPTPLPVYPPQMFVYRVTVQPDAEERITLWNNSSSSMDLIGWELGDRANPHSYTFSQNTLLLAGQKLELAAAWLGLKLQNRGEEIYLYDTSGALISSWQDPAFPHFPSTLFIARVDRTPGQETVVLQNNNKAEVFLAAWQLRLDGGSSVTLPSNLSLGSDQQIVFLAAPLGLSLPSAGSFCLILLDPSGLQVDQYVSP